jgi:hypothetical protein
MGYDRKTFEGLELVNLRSFKNFVSFKSHVISTSEVAGFYYSQ